MLCVGFDDLWSVQQDLYHHQHHHLSRYCGLVDHSQYHRHLEITTERMLWYSSTEARDRRRPQ
jgi:hypothetical protein